MKKIASLSILLIGIGFISKAQPLQVELYKNTISSDNIFGIGQHEDQLFYHYIYLTLDVSKSEFINKYHQLDSTVATIERLDINTGVKKSIDIKSGLDSIMRPCGFLPKYHNGKFYYLFSRMDSAFYFQEYTYNPRRMFLLEVDSSFSSYNTIPIGSEFGDSLYYNNRYFLLKDSFSFHLWYAKEDSVIDKIYLLKHDLNSGNMVDSVFLEPNTILNDFNVYAINWLDDSLIVSYGDETNIINSNNMTVDTHSYLNWDHYTDFGVLLSDLMYNPVDSSMYYFSYNNQFTQLHRINAYCKMQKYNEIDPHLLPGWVPNGYFTSGGNHFLYPDYNYLLHFSVDQLKCLFMCFDENGDLRWSKVFNSKTDSIQALAVQGISDSGLVAFIMMDKPNDPDLDAYVIKLDKYGNQDLTWLDNNSPILDIQDALILYPSPTKQSIHLANTNLHDARGEVSILDIQGRVVLRRSFSPEIDVSSLTSGTYIYHLSTPASEVPLSATFVVE